MSSPTYLWGAEYVTPAHSRRASAGPEHVTPEHVTLPTAARPVVLTALRAAATPGSASCAGD